MLWDCTIQERGAHPSYPSSLHPGGHRQVMWILHRIAPECVIWLISRVITQGTGSPLCLQSQPVVSLSNSRCLMGRRGHCATYGVMPHSHRACRFLTLPLPTPFFRLPPIFPLHSFFLPFFMLYKISSMFNVYNLMIRGMSTHSWVHTSVYAMDISFNSKTSLMPLFIISLYKLRTHNRKLFF